MQKIVVRTSPVPYISSRMCMFGFDPCQLNEICQTKGLAFVLKNIFDDEMPLESLLDDFKDFSNGNQSRYFTWMYLLDQEYGVVINEHITLCRFDQSYLDAQKSLFPWIYYEHQKYLGDTWWFSDEEILNDLQNISIVQFIKKYKGM